MKDIKLSEKIKIIPRKRLEDSRGWFLKAITGNEDNLPNHTGEIYTVYAEPGLSRGGHYHKLAKEWFTLLTGKAVLQLRDMQTGEYMSIDLDANNPTTIYVPPFIAHQFNATEKTPFLLLAYTDELYNPSDTINYEFIDTNE